ncbi:alpha-ketoglutarate-dependent dioxygenase AlkB family protein [Chitinophaga caeni]|nr:alpha-ketoglutarate-dependent dioxygenase AlkB [Chitinophaga caeni]
MMQTNQENLLPFHGNVYFFPNFFGDEESRELFESLYHELHWKHKPIKIFGKEIMQPRLTAFYGDPGTSYTYSGLQQAAIPWHPALSGIKRKIETACPEPFNCVLANLYRDGQDSMGWHRDNEESLGACPTIASVSLGASRSFQMRDYATKSTRLSFELGNGSLLIMSGETQQYWEHQVPKSKPISSPRINLTFRHIMANF